MRFFNKELGLVFLFVWALSGGAACADENVVSDGQVEVTTADVKRLVALQVPESEVEAFFQDEKAVRDAIASLYLTRRIAIDARNEGLDAEAQWVESYFRDLGLRRLQIRRVVEREVEHVDLEQMAREHYLAHPQQFVRPEAVRVSHILIDPKGREPGEARSIAERLLSEVKENPERFAELARENSDDHDSAAKGGDLGFFSRSQMVKPFADAAFALKEPGQVAGPIETQFGYHIIRLEERRPESKLRFDEVKTRLIEKARKRVEERAKEEYLSKLRSADTIESRQEVINALVKPLADSEKVLKRDEAPSAAD